MKPSSNDGLFNPSKEVVISIPCGAMGNLTAGLIAREMGLPIRFVCGVNANDVVHKFLTTGRYEVKPVVQKTVSPAMDIAVPYNVERILWLLSGLFPLLQREG